METNYKKSNIIILKKLYIVVDMICYRFLGLKRGLLL